jgi:hypothetical protein
MAEVGKKSTEMVSQTAPYRLKKTVGFHQQDGALPASCNCARGRFVSTVGSDGKSDPAVYLALTG